MCRTEKRKGFSKPRHINALPYVRTKNVDWRNYDED